MVCLYEVAFKIGLRLPLPKFVADVLSYLQVAPGQLMPNAWRVILGMQVLSEVMNVQMSVDTFCHFYTVKKVSSDKGRVQTNSRPGVDSSVCIGNASDKSTWKERYFLVSSEHVFEPTDLARVPISWKPFGKFNSGYLV